MIAEMLKTASEARIKLQRVESFLQREMEESGDMEIPEVLLDRVGGPAVTGSGEMFLWLVQGRYEIHIWTDHFQDQGPYKLSAYWRNAKGHVDKHLLNISRIASLKEAIVKSIELFPELHGKEIA